MAVDAHGLLAKHYSVRDENYKRLMEVTSLEQLVNFKVKTLADVLSEQSLVQTVDSVDNMQSLVS